MNIVIFGLSVSSSWGNGHAVLWRGMIAALLARGCHVTFFERDAPYYAAHRDLHELPPGGRLLLYGTWAEVADAARDAVRRADLAIVTSYCPDALAATRLLGDMAPPVACFYDMDTPVTLQRLQADRTVDYLGPDGLAPFDLVFSYTGGEALAALRDRLGARRVVPLYGWVDPDAYRRGRARPEFASSLGYLGTYAEDRQAALMELLVQPARARPDWRFVIAGAQYPSAFPWTDNIFFVCHLPQALHGDFYASIRVTLNVTRGAMARMGWCPSGRLFEAAACGTPIISDAWPGLEDFFTPGEEILVAADRRDVLAACDLPDGDLARIAARARARVLAEHSAARRAQTLLHAVERTATRLEA